MTAAPEAPPPAAEAEAARAGWPEVRPGRPSFSDTAQPTERGAIGVDVGGLFTDGAFGVPVMLRYGLSESLDLRVAFSQSFHPAAGLDGFLVMAKSMLLAPEEGSVGFAWAPYLSAPTTLGDELASGGVVLITTWPINEDWQVDANVIAHVSPSPGEDARVEIDPVVALAFPVAGPVGGYAESYALLPGTGTDPSLGVGLGLGIEVCDPLVIDASLDLGTGPDLAPWTVQLGGTFEFWGPGEG